MKWEKLSQKWFQVFHTHMTKYQMTFRSIERRGSCHLTKCLAYILFQMGMQEKFPAEAVVAGEWHPSSCQLLKHTTVGRFTLSAELGEHKQKSQGAMPKVFRFSYHLFQQPREPGISRISLPRSTFQGQIQNARLLYFRSLSTVPELT